MKTVRKRIYNNPWSWADKQVGQNTPMDRLVFPGVYLRGTFQICNQIQRLIRERVKV